MKVIISQAEIIEAIKDWAENNLSDYTPTEDEIKFRVMDGKDDGAVELAGDYEITTTYEVKV